MLRIGITGGIGSGKTTVCKIFETLGVPVYYADDRAKWLMVHEPKLVNQIKSLLGTEAYLPDGSLNRQYVAGKIFKKNSLRLGLNAIVHPAVQQDGQQWFNQLGDVPYGLYEAALLYESGGYQSFDFIIVVTAPEALRIERVVKRDGTTPEAVAARINSQMPEVEKVKKADFVINNDGQHSLIKEVLKIHHQLLDRC